MGAASQPLPSGRVALMFSDVEGSTALLGRLGEAYGEVLDAHDRIMRTVFADLGGHEFSNEGDAFGAAFADPTAAATAALRIQRALDASRWPEGERLRVRIGLHYGEPKLRGNDYWGEDVHFTARVCSAAHGGQVVLSAAMRAAVPGLDAVSLGHHGLKDFPAPRELFQLIGPGLDPGPFPAPRTLSTFRTNLPSIAAPLYGREDALVDLDELFRTGHRLVTVVGPGGMGKTRVAVALGERIAPRFRDGVAFVPLAAVDDRGVAAAVADATLAARGGSADESTVVEHLRRRELLLVLDNCEHVPAASSIVASILAGCPTVHVLATSQMPLDLSAELVRRLPPLSVPSEGDDGPTDSSAVTMFVEHARARDDSFVPTEDLRPKIVALCRLLEGMPLAIELAAARVRLTGLDRLLAALQRDLDALSTGARDLPDRHRSLRAALDWTVSLLTDAERDVFAGLGAFAESWSVEQAERLFADAYDELEVWDAMTRLVDASLVVVKGDGRFAMPERVRRHAAELLGRSPHEALRRRRHAEMVGQDMRDRTLEMVVEYRRMLADVADLLPEVLRALSWARGADRDTYRRVVGLAAPGLAKLGQLAVVANDLPELDVVDQEPRCYEDAAIAFAIGLGHAMRFSTDVEGETAAFERAARGFESFGDPREVAAAGYMVACALEANGLTDEALDRIIRAAAAAGAVDDPRWQVELERMSAGFFHEEGDAELRTRVVERLGVGAGTFSLNYPQMQMYDAAASGDHARAIALGAQMIVGLPRQHLYLNLNAVKQLAWHLAEEEHDEAALELVAAVDRIYLARTGVHHGSTLPQYQGAFDAARRRLAARADDVLVRAGRLSYDELVVRAAALASEFGSARVDERA